MDSLSTIELKTLITKHQNFLGTIIINLLKEQVKLQKEYRVLSKPMMYSFGMAIRNVYRFGKAEFNKNTLKLIHEFERVYGI